MAMRAFGRGVFRAGRQLAPRFQSGGPGQPLPDHPPQMNPQEVEERLQAGRLALEKYAAEDPEGEGVVKTNYAMGELLLMKEDDASTAEALVHLTRAVRMQEKRDPGTEPLAKAYYLVGHVHVSAKDIESGLACFRKAGAILEALPQTDAVLTETTKVWFIVGQLLVANRQEEEGYEAYQKVFAAAKQGVTDAEWNYMASLYRRVAQQFHKRNDFERAEALYKEALALCEKHQPDGEETANFYYTLAQVQLAGAQGKAPEVYHEALLEAEKLCDKSLAIIKEKKPDDVEAAALFNIIAQIKHMLRQMDAAIESQAKAVSILEAKKYPNNLLHQSYKHLAMLHTDQENADEAAAYEKKAEDEAAALEKRIKEYQEEMQRQQQQAGQQQPPQ